MTEIEKFFGIDDITSTISLDVKNIHCLGSNNFNSLIESSIRLEEEENSILINPICIRNDNVAEQK